MFFEEVIRENLDLGRPDEVQLLFDRKIIRTTPGRFRTRVVTEGVTPILNVYYKNTRIKQYHKEGRALRTETTINNTWDFRVHKSLRHLPKVRQIGFQANRRLLQVERISHDCILADLPAVTHGRRLVTPGNDTTTRPFYLRPRLRSLRCESASANFAIRTRSFGARAARSRKNACSSASSSAIAAGAAAIIFAQ